MSSTRKVVYKHAVFYSLRKNAITLAVCKTLASRDGLNRAPLLNCTAISSGATYTVPELC